MFSFFDILDLPETFSLDEKALEKAYFNAQREVHPDRLIGKSEQERGEAIIRSQIVNDAYDTLKNPITRAEHLLELHDIIVLGDESTDVPPELLMEMMELRERIEAVAGDGRGLLNITEEIKKAAQVSTDALEQAFTARNYEGAGAETLRLHYLAKALEEAYMLLYRFKATAAHE